MRSLLSFVALALAIVLALDFAATQALSYYSRSMGHPASFAARFDAVAPELPGEQIDRTRKTSRLIPTALTPGAASIRVQAPSNGSVRETIRSHDPAPPQEAERVRIPAGCDPAYSALSTAAPPRFVGRCVA